MEFEQYGGYTRLGYELDHSWNVSADLNLTHFNASNPGTVSTPVFDNDSHITRGMTSFAQIPYRGDDRLSGYKIR